MRVLLRSCLESVRVSFALLRPLHPAFAFSRALAPRRRLISRAPSSRRLFSVVLSRPLHPPVAPPLAPTQFVCFSHALVPPLPGIYFLSRFRAPFNHRLLFLALSRRSIFLASPLPGVYFLSCSRASSALRLLFFALSRLLLPAFVFCRAFAPPPPTVCD